MIAVMITIPGADATAAAVMVEPGASACVSGANVVMTAAPAAGASEGGGSGASANGGAA
jgi:hypothetical protein